LLGFTKAHKLSSFEQVFPATRRPQVSMFSGQPRVPRDTFNDLLKSKLSQLRSCLGLTSTPKGIVTIVASWINKLLASLVPKTHSVKKDRTQPKPDKAKKTKVESTVAPTVQSFEFIPASETQTEGPPTIVASATDSVEPNTDLMTFSRYSLVDYLSANWYESSYSLFSSLDYHSIHDLIRDCRPLISRIHAFSAIEAPAPLLECAYLSCLLHRVLTLLFDSPGPTYSSKLSFPAPSGLSVPDTSKVSSTLLLVLPLISN
jgi:hypothetical protein